MDKIKIGRLIKKARRKAGFSKEELAGRCAVTTEVVADWELGENLPTMDVMMQIVEVTNVSYAALIASFSEDDEMSFDFRNRFFREDNMFTRMQDFALRENLGETIRALSYMRERHLGQFRKPNRYAKERIRYISHPLMMACHAHALGIKDDALLASILLHDVVEDTDITVEELPFSEEVRQIVNLVSYEDKKGMSREEGKMVYYREIKKNGKACMVKCLDRCNNVSTMAGSFTRERCKQYIEETEKYIYPLLTELKTHYPEYNDSAFLIKYQLVSLIETMKYLF